MITLKPLLSLMLILLFSALFLPSGSQPSISIAQDDLTITPEATQIATETETSIYLENTLNTRLEFLEVDITCSENCWSTFIVGETEMGVVFDWFKQNFNYDVDYQRNQTAPNNFIEVGIGGNIHIKAFSDRQNPSLLRAVYVIISPTNNPQLQNGIGAISPEHIQFLLPSSILEELNDLPSQIVIANNEPFYKLIIDFHDVGIAFTYSGRLSEGGICFDEPINRIGWVAYSQNELSALRLLNELEQYEGSSILKASYNETFLITNPNKIQQITDHLAVSSCLTLQDYAY